MTLLSAIQECLAGLYSVLAWPELGFLVIGVLTGAVVGLLPGFGGAATLAVFLPFSIGLPPTEAFALLMGVAAVTATTGDLTSILVGIPGEATAAATVLDGHAMTTRGDSARAMGASLVSSLVGSLVGAVMLAVTVPVVLAFARSIGSPELFVLGLLGVSLMATVSPLSLPKGLAMGGLGLLLATVGLDQQGATPRFTFGQLYLWDGISPVAVALGLLAIPEVLAMTTGPSSVSTAGVATSRLVDGVRDARRLWRLLVQSSVIGTGVGLLPGVGAGVSQWVAYGYAARRGSGGRPFGEGAVEGVIAPSAANNATMGASLVPALALGIPGGLMSAILISALILKGLTPGPSMLLPEAQGGQAALVFALVWLIVFGNVLAVGLAFLGSGWLVRIAEVRASRLVPPLLLLVFVGAFAQRQIVADVFIVGLMGALGLVLVRYRWPRAPLLLGVVLGPLVENRFFLSMDAYGTQWLLRPGVLVLLAILAVGVVVRRRTVRPTPTGGEAEPPGPTLLSRGELALALGLVGVLAAAYIAAESYSPTAALAPRLIIVATAALLVGLLVADLRRRRAGTATVASPVQAGPANRTALWIALYPGLILGLGYVLGGFLAAAGHLLVGGERPVRAVALAAGVVLLLYAMLYRLLGVALPAGVWFS